MFSHRQKNIGADQPVLLSSLISACIDSIVRVTVVSVFKLASVTEQAGLSIT